MSDAVSDAVGAAQRRVVDHLKRSGPVTTGALAAALDVTPQAVRVPLAELEERGLVVAEPATTGARGRPPLVWTLTPLAIDLFPDRHGDLTVELIDALRRALGDDGLDAVLAARDEAHLGALRDAMTAASTTRERVEILAAQRSAQGYMAEVRADGDDLLLVEHHCPICAAATVCQGLCRNELTLFQEAIGDGAEVERTAHLLSGDDRCVYRIRTRSGS